MPRKYKDSCCDNAKYHCAFCSILLCPRHAEDVEVEGYIFWTCEHCAETLRVRRPGTHEECLCHDEEYCEIHQNIGGIG